MTEFVFKDRLFSSLSNYAFSIGLIEGN